MCGMNDRNIQLPRTCLGLQTAAETTYIVMDRAERLRGLHASVLPALLRLQELVCPARPNCSSGCRHRIAAHLWNSFDSSVLAALL